ncbi:MAG TPA: protein kinase [Candidatus Sulfopaludibacter sp.]|nr:protein kinase [Candidatus Sulfopaludibacter sp.]
MTPERWRQVEELYLAALDLKGEERSALLARAPADVRAEVKAMLEEGASTILLNRGVWGNVLDEPTATLLAEGAELGQYRIESRIGAGGMGVVFRAHDNKLSRPVAIKFLSDELVDAAARRRFQREAQMASSLNHPHILTVYDVGEILGRQYLVTEFVDGGTLQSWVQRQPRSWEDVVDLLTGAADGLAMAHQAGILHRDIKPTNILVTESGYAKLADFGLAKLEDDRSLAGGVPVEDRTRKGALVGTIPYMSPEQASGMKLDSRSDIFSFGVVLYEMLAGRRPFQAATNLQLLQEVIHGKPAPLSSGLPEPLRALVMKALEKNPADRHSSMREVVTGLRSLQRSGTSQVPGRKWGRRRTLAVGLSAAMLATIGAVLWRPSGHGSSTPRLEYVPLTNFTDSAVAPTLSPDGRMLAFIRGEGTFIAPGDVYVQMLPAGEPVRLTHDGGEKMGPVSFSADGSRIAYTLGEWDTWSVPVLGGEPSRLLANAEGLSWFQGTGKPYRVMYSALTGRDSVHMGVYTATESRSEERAVYLPPATGMAHRSWLSPNGKWVLVVEMNKSAWLPCRVVPFDGSSPGQRVGPQPAQCTDAAWTPDGKWVYVSANTGAGFHIWRQRFPDGVPEQVTSGATEEQGISFAGDGKSFVTSVGETQSTLWIHDSKGDRQITFEGFAYLPSFSSDTRRIYYLRRSSGNRRFVNGELWTTDLQNGNSQRLLPDFSMERYDVSPDGKQIVFINVDAAGHAQLWIGTVDGSSPPRVLANQNSTAATFAPNGEIFFVGGKGEEMYLQRIEADGTGLQKIIPEQANFLYDISPDGKWVSVWVGRDIRVYPSGGGPPTAICTGCGSTGAELRGVTPPRASWSRNGKEFYLYSESTRRTYSVPIEPGRALPQLPPSGITWQHGPPAIAGTETIPHERPFLSPNPAVYAYLDVSVHRNIYRIPVP